MKLEEGSLAPAWTACDQDGVLRSSSDYVGRWLLLYFYPKDDTPGCTTQACGFRDSIAAFRDRAEILGVSRDDGASHRRFINKYSLPFPLLADVDGSLTKAFGADGLMFPKRTTFLIDAHGVIRKIRHGFDCKDHAVYIDTDLRSYGA